MLFDNLLEISENGIQVKPSNLSILSYIIKLEPVRKSRGKLTIVFKNTLRIWLFGWNNLISFHIFISKISLPPYCALQITRPKTHENSYCGVVICPSISLSGKVKMMMVNEEKMTRFMQIRINTNLEFQGKNNNAMCVLTNMLWTLTYSL